jgi:hypothetical protein
MLPIAQKNSARKDWCFQCREVGNYAPNLVVWRASCQFNKRRFGKNNASLGAGALSLDDRRCSLVILV